MNKIQKLVADHEGLRLKPYKCTAGKITIGYGRNLDDNGISAQEAEAMFARDLTETYADLSQFEWFKDLDEAREAVMVDMCYNLGIVRLKKFEKTLLFVEKGLYHAAADEMLDSRWAKQVKGRAITLSKMMDTGQWQ
ncbi:MAG: lysozyme [Planctomycetes bacterium]|nr:lysozyme [Planctomycetota bacterium]